MISHEKYGKLKTQIQMQISLATYRKIVFIALVALIAIIITGGIVRITGSGLGCSDWPNCEPGQLAPDPGSEDAVPAYVEFINRAITGVVSLAVILAVLGAIFLVPRKKNLIWWSLGLVGGVLAQIVLGAVVVATDLSPQTVMAHFLVSMLLVLNAVILHSKTTPNIRPPLMRNPYIIWVTRLTTLISIAVIFTGTILTGAGPHSGDKGEDELITRFDLDISNLARIHASLVITFVSLLLLGWMLLHIFRNNLFQSNLFQNNLDAHKRILKKGNFLLVVALSQGALGYIQYFSAVPAVLVGFHIAGAALLWTAMVYFHLEVCQNKNKN